MIALNTVGAWTHLSESYTLERAQRSDQTRELEGRVSPAAASAREEVEAWRARQRAATVALPFALGDAPAGCGYNPGLRKRAEAQKATCFEARQDGSLCLGPLQEQQQGPTFDQVAQQLRGAANADALSVAADLIGSITDPAQQAELNAIYETRMDEMSA